MKRNQIAVAMTHSEQRVHPSQIAPPRTPPTRVSHNGEWKEYLDETSGTPFYLNIRTGVTQWDAPSGFGFDSTSLENPMHSGSTQQNFEIESPHTPHYGKNFSRPSANSWATNYVKKPQVSIGQAKAITKGKTQLWKYMAAICCCICVLSLGIALGILFSGGTKGKVIAPGANDGSNDGETVTTTAAPISPRPPATVLPTRLVGQQLKLVGLSLSQVQANLNEIRVGIAKALNVANDDVLIASVSSQQRRRRRLNQGAVYILYKVKVLDDDAVAKMKTRIRSVVVQAKIKKEIIEVIPNVAQSDVSMSSTEPTSEVYNPNPVTTRPPQHNFDWRECGNTSVPTPQPNGYPKDLPPGLAVLPKSPSNVILTLNKIFASDCLTIPVARSYDGNVWEGVWPSPHKSISCNSISKVCQIETSNTNQAFRIDAYALQADELRSSNETISRFLMQATYGPSQEQINDFVQFHGPSVTQASVSTYLNDQMNNVPATFLREHFRSRTNPRTPVKSAAGAPRTMCEANSRFHRFAFNQLDLQKTLNISTMNPNSGTYELRIHGVLRTEISALAPSVTTLTPGNLYVICKVKEWSGTTSAVYVYDSNKKCKGNNYIHNPLISFTSPDPKTTQSFGVNGVVVEDLDLPFEDSILIKKFESTCNDERQVHGVSFIKLSGRSNDKTYYKYDPRLRLLTNSLENPANVSAFQDISLQCPTVEKSFLNRKSCVRVKNSCTPLQFSSGQLHLNSSNLRLWYTANNLYIHYITGLRLEDSYDVSPCLQQTSRWKKLNAGPCVGGTTSALAGTATKDTIVNAIANAVDTNQYIRDIQVYHKDHTCDKNLKNIVGAKVEANNFCWQHVHPHEYNVYDFTRWTIEHDGNKIAAQNGRPNPIMQFAIEGKANFQYPSWHSMSRWKQKVGKFIKYVGRYGDIVNFESLNTEVQTYELAQISNAVSSDGSDGFESCGSPGEVENMPSYGHLYRFPSERLDLGINHNDEVDFPHNNNAGKHMVWLNVALKSKDSLRQKIAWALSQILVISESGLNGKNDEIENWIIYYDIFIRNAFGNYRDILKEVTYSPMMGTYLTYMQNKAYKASKTFPDENYAREIMQLFTIGLWKLNIDGTYDLDAEGNKQETYTNDDIVSFARIWTGFDRVLRRSNVEQQIGTKSGNWFDPMQIKTEWRDIFPKRALDKGYIGDGYPICNDLPVKHEFLTPGATYINTGAHSTEGDYYDTTAPSSYRRQFELSSSDNSELYKLLCHRSEETAKCRFPDRVTLTERLKCVDDECEMDFVRVIKVIDTDGKIQYYTYQRQPCVRLTFFDQGKVSVDMKSLKEDRLDVAFQCANPHSKAAGASCCDSSGIIQDLPYKRQNDATACNFALEFMTYNTTKSRCRKLGFQMCNGLTGQDWTKSFKKGCGPYIHSWTSQSCQYKIQIQPSGYMSIVDEERKRTEYELNNENYFLLRWTNDNFPKVSNNGGCGAGCVARGTSCLCNITVIDSVGFTSLPSVNEVEEHLFVGAYSPLSFFNASVYTLCSSNACNTHFQTHHMRIFLRSASGNSNLDENTIFELPPKLPGGAVRYLRNMVSMVHVGSEFRFRNPPSFLPNLGETYTYRGSGFSSKFHQPEATNEVEAMLDHVFEHKNTAPFVSHRLIQRLVTSNPSPRYVKAVSNAFRKGMTSDGKVYSGKYGDLGAAVAEILLDHEARSTVLDADPRSGKLREPLLKVVHLLKAMEYKSKDAREVNLLSMDIKIGQEPFSSPTVFNFFLPEFAPPGPIHESGLTSPESQLLTTPLLIGFLNGVESLISYGLTNCNYGFGDRVAKPKRSCSNTEKESTADGRLYFTPSASALQNGVEGIVKELDLLLTTGRLNKNSRRALVKAYSDSLQQGSADDALKVALKLLLMTSEFHTTAINRLRPKRRPSPSGIQSQNRRYKAVVVLFQAGAADSFNMIVPHSGCGSTHDLHQEYKDVRTNVALDKADLLPIDVPVNTQPCNKFGIHPSLSILKQQYDAGNASFIANMGALVEPITKSEYVGKKKRVPPSLFAHNIMQRAMHTVHAQDASSTGILGRIVKTISNEQTDSSDNVVQPYKSSMYSLSGNQRMLEGAAPEQTPNIIDRRNGIVKYLKYNALKDSISNVSASVSENIFAETFSSNLNVSLRQTEHLGGLLNDVVLSTEFGEDAVSSQLKQVSKLIKLRSALKTERDVFVISHGGYDTHNDAGEVFKGKMDEMNAGLTSFVSEMVHQGVYEDIVVVSTSDFGRTLTSNGQGTDHAWGGNYFVLGGGVKGKRILGQYPEKLGAGGSLNIGRGRILPTRSWESLWNAVSEWFGVVPNKMDYVLPNKANFPADQLFSEEDLFKN